MTVADWAQQGFLRRVWHGDLLPRDSIYSLLAEHRIVSDEDFPTATQNVPVAPRSRRACSRR